MSTPNRQSGNVIFIIIIMIGLFAALSFAVNQAMRGDNISGVESQKLDIAATEIIGFGNQIATAVSVLKANGCSDTQITFEDNNSTSKQTDGVVFNYTNPNAPTDKTCHVFSVSGGGVTPLLLSKEGKVDPSIVPSGYYHPYSWAVSHIRIAGIKGDTTAASDTDLVAFIGRPTKELCMKINDKLGITNPGGAPPSDAFCVTSFFQGTYASCNYGMGDGASAIKGKSSFCVYSGSNPYDYLYMQVLIPR